MTHIAVLKPISNGTISGAYHVVALFDKVYANTVVVFVEAERDSGLRMVIVDGPQFKIGDKVVHQGSHDGVSWKEIPRNLDKNLGLVIRGKTTTDSADYHQRWVLV